MAAAAAAKRWRWAVIRHGERCPVSEYRTTGVTSIGAEKDLWRALLPNTEDVSLLASRFPASHDNGCAWRPTFDRLADPFGALTSRGLESARHLGARYRGDGLEYVIRSTNYGRTLLTARASVSSLGGKGPIFVRERCVLNGFDVHPQLTREAMARVRRAFLDEEATMGELRRALIDAIPGATEENFGWLLAVDFAESRKAHQIPSYDDSLLLEAKRYLQRRYTHYLRDAQLRALVAIPLLNELANALRTALHDPAPPSVLNFAHDVTVLALLYGLDARLPSPAWMPPFACDCALSLNADLTVTLSVDNQPLRFEGHLDDHNGAIDAHRFLAHIIGQRDNITQAVNQ